MPKARGCSVEGCKRFVYAKGFCNPHWSRARKHGGDPGPAEIEERIPAAVRGTRCAVEGCETPRRRGALCSAHGHKRRRYGNPNEPHHRRKNGEGDVYGYLLRYAPDHPNSNGAGQILEHRFRMSEYIGRALLPGENVHHRDGDRAHNTVGPCYGKRECDCQGVRHNLELWVVSQVPGQRVADKIQSWVEALELYAGLLSDEQRMRLKRALR